MGFRRRFFLVSIVLIATSVVSADLYLSAALRSELEDRLRADLRVRLTMAAEQVRQQPDPLRDPERWDRLADEIGRLAGVRLTFIRADGVVVGDSEVPRDELAAVENHAARPEVRQALAGETGFDTRTSATVHRAMMYVAVPFMRDGGTIGVVRAAFPLTEIERALGRMHRALGIASVIALLVALLVSTVLTQLMARAMDDITEGARRMAEGDLGVRIDSPQRDELGQIARALDKLAANLSATLRDLRAERDLLGRILEGMEEGVLVANAERRVVLMNPALRAILRGDASEPVPEDAVGRPALEVIRNADLHRILEATLSSRSPTTGEITVGGRKLRRLLVHAAPLEGEPRGCVAVFVDVTEIRRLESVRRDFVANVSHELRTPVTAVRTALETARPALQGDPGTADKFLDIAERNAERLVSLVRDLLDLSQLESGDFKLSLEPIDVGRLGDHVVDLFHEPAGRRQIRLRTDWPASPLEARADRRALEQVLTNLVDNAVKYGGEGGEVALAARADGGQIRITVTDTGPGIEPHHVPRLFERFYRVDSGRSRDRGGTGLGLSIVKHLAEAMGGAIAVESTLGRGSTFTVTLPAG